jgi:outer membrane receptor protein involved in Fe transport
MRNKISTVLVFLFLSLPMYVFGEEKDASRYILNPIIVTATKIPQQEEYVTQKVDVIEKEEFPNIAYDYGNIAELLTYQPGTFVNVLSRNDANWGSYGGLGPKYNTYLLDGIPIDSFVDGMGIDPWVLDRVEVQRGPAAVMYSNYLSQDFAGNQTPLAGTSNFILREKVEKPLTRILVGGGKYNTFEGKVYHEGNTGNFHYFVGGSYQQSDYTNYGANPSWLSMIDDPDYQKLRLYFKTTYFFADDHKISLFGHHMNHTGDVGRPNRDYDHTYDTINLVYAKQINDRLNAQLKAGYRYYDRQWNEDNFPANLALREQDEVKQTIIPVDLTFSLKHLQKSLLSFGADYQHATYKTYAEVGGINTKGNDASAYNVGVYAQEELIFDKWVIRAGGRYNDTKNTYNLLSGTVPEVGDKSWNKFLWSGGIKFNATEQLSLYTNGGSSFLVPSAKSVGGTLRSTDLGVPGRNGQLPNPNLRPESGTGIDGGVNWGPLKNLKFGLRGFYNVVDDAIVENRVSLDPSQSQSVNAGKSISHGIELEAKQIINQYIQWFANYTYTWTKLKNGVDPDQDRSNLNFVPKYSGNAGLTLSLPKDIFISPYLNAVGVYYDSTSKSGRLKFGPYQTVNVNVRKAFVTTSSGTFNLTVDLYNVLNQKYEMPWQFQNPGFSMFVGLEARF